MTSVHEVAIQEYVSDLVAVLDHVLQAMARHSNNDNLARIENGEECIQSTRATLTRHREALIEHAKNFGGTTGVGFVKDMLMTVSGAFAGMYGTVRPETASRMLRDDYTALSFLSACTTMLHTTALACNEGATSDLTLQLMREYPPLILAVSEILPHAVVADLVIDKIPLANPNAAQDAVRNLNASWHHRS